MVKRTQQRQVNIRLDDETLALLDECRAEQRTPQGNIPTRSDVVRQAIEKYLSGLGKCPPKQG
ncbi:ribbon-helix-helix domain-containing protein [Ectothiorhodospira sp. BSL-9]|uniref:ribbon-helix-helix domain-containing protein n=1 Tax=Ectothiorhodospira sp. BSL-9 TaxID=1442136 RepID=UPI00352950EF